MKAKLLPFFLARISRIPYEYITQLTFDKHLIDLIDALFNAEISLSHKIEIASAVIFEQVAQCNSALERNKLIALRRNIFNKRSVKNERWLKPAVYNLIEEYNILRLSKEDLEKKIQLAYKIAIDEIRRKLVENFEDTNLARSLPLISESLTNGLQLFRRRPLVSPLPSKFRKIEQSLAQVLTRAITKTTPLASFVGIAKVNFRNHCTCNDYIITEEIRDIKLNGYLFKRLYNALLLNLKFLLETDVVLNSSILCEVDNYYFIAGEFNGEKLQQIKRNVFTDFVYSIFNSRRVKKFKTVLNLIRKEYSINKDDGVLQVFSLVYSGFIVLEFKANYKRDEWLSECIKEIEFKNRGLDQTLKKVCSNLAEVSKTVSDLADFKSSAGRNLHLSNIREKIDDCINHLIEERSSVLKEHEFTIKIIEFINKTENSIRSERAIYEDALLQIEMNRGLKDDIKRAHELLMVLASKLYFPLEKSKNRFLYSFDKMIEEKGGIKLLDCYFLFSKGIVKSKLWDFEKIVNHAAIKKLVENIKQNKEGSIGLTVDNLDEILNYKGQDTCENNEEFQSFSAYLQIIKGQGQKAQFVLNGDGPIVGMGKGFSRFLKTEDREFIKLIKKFNCETSKELLIECNDGSYFNANIHPPLLDAEIEFPGAASLFSKKKRVKISSLIVTKGCDKNTYKIINHETGEEVSFYDLSLQAKKNRSPFFNFLAILNNSAAYSPLPVIIKEIYSLVENASDGSGILFFPRIIFEKTIIIRRKSWSINKSSFPVILSTELEELVFVKIYRWAITNNLPTRFYAYHNAIKSDSQYIDLASPLLSRLFLKNYLVASQIIIEEFLPAPKDYLLTENKTYAGEFLIQWNQA